MKKIIRLTETDLHNLVREMTCKVLNEAGWGNNGWRTGYVKPDGNQMTGGNYGSRSHGYIPVDISEKFFDETYKILRQYGDTYQEVMEMFFNEENPFIINVCIDSEYDESTGYGSEMFPINTIRDVKGEEKIVEFIDNFQQGDEIFKQAAKKALESTIDNLDADECLDDDY